MKLIQEAIKDLQKEVKSLREEVSTGKGIVKVLVFLGTIAATIIGFFTYKVKYYNKGIAAHLEAILKLLDDDHLVFENIQGVGPIDIVTVNKHTGKVTFYDAKSDEIALIKKDLNQIYKKN